MLSPALCLNHTAVMMNWGMSPHVGWLTLTVPWPCNSLQTSSQSAEHWSMDDSALRWNSYAVVGERMYPADKNRNTGTPFYHALFYITRDNFNTRYTHLRERCRDVQHLIRQVLWVIKEMSWYKLHLISTPLSTVILRNPETEPYSETDESSLYVSSHFLLLINFNIILCCTRQL